MMRAETLVLMRERVERAFGWCQNLNEWGTTYAPFTDRDDLWTWIFSLADKTEKGGA